MYAAVYDKDGILIEVKEVEKDSMTAEFSLKAVEYVKAFIWEEFNPVCDSYAVSIN